MNAVPAMVKEFEEVGRITRVRVRVGREIVMRQRLRRIRNAVAMGLTWAAVWAVFSVVIGTMTELLSGYSLETHVDPLAAPAMPGFVGGLVYSTLLQFAEGGRRYGELALPRLAAWGAGVGLLLGVLPFALGTPSARFPLWQLVVTIVGSATLLGVVSAVGSALLFRLAARPRAPAGAGPKG